MGKEHSSKPAALMPIPFRLAAIGDSQVPHLGLMSIEENDNPQLFLSTPIRRKIWSVALLLVAPLNKGIPGNISAQIAARIQAAAVEVDPKPTHCSISPSAQNNVAVGAPAATLRDNIQDA